MRLLAISDPEFIPGEAELINSLFREGLECFHVRKPGSTQADFKKLLSEISSDFLNKIAIHQHHCLAAEFGMKRLHFTEKDRNLTSIKVFEARINEGFLLSTSVHDLNEISNLSTLFSYTFFGPVFDSISKKGYKSILTANFYIKPEMKKIPVIGLGGIDSKNLEKVKKMNFDGAAVLGTLWKNPENGIANFRILMDVVNGWY